MDDFLFLHVIFLTHFGSDSQEKKKKKREIDLNKDTGNDVSCSHNDSLSAIKLCGT